MAKEQEPQPKWWNPFSWNSSRWAAATLITAGGLALLIAAA